MVVHGPGGAVRKETSVDRFVAWHFVGGLKEVRTLANWIEFQGSIDRFEAEQAAGKDGADTSGSTSRSETENEDPRKKVSGLVTSIRSFADWLELKLLAAEEERKAGRGKKRASMARPFVLT